MLLRSTRRILLQPFIGDACHSFGATPIIPLCLYDDGNCGETCHNHYDIAFICCATLLQFMHPLKNFFVLLHFHILKTLDKELSFLYGPRRVPSQRGSGVGRNITHRNPFTEGHEIDFGHEKAPYGNRVPKPMKGFK